MMWYVAALDASSWWLWGSCLIVTLHSAGIEVNQNTLRLGMGVRWQDAASSPSVQGRGGNVAHVKTCKIVLHYDTDERAQP